MLEVRVSFGFDCIGDIRSLGKFNTLAELSTQINKKVEAIDFIPRDCGYAILEVVDLNKYPEGIVRSGSVYKLDIMNKLRSLGKVQ